MVHGTGCNHASELFDTIQEARAYAKAKVKDIMWTGRIIIYKLIPKAEAEPKTVLSMFKSSDIVEL